MWKRTKEVKWVTKSSLIGQDIQQAEFRWQNFNAEKWYLAHTKITKIWWCWLLKTTYFTFLYTKRKHLILQQKYLNQSHVKYTVNGCLVKKPPSSSRQLQCSSLQIVTLKTPCTAGHITKQYGTYLQTDRGSIRDMSGSLQDCPGRCLAKMDNYNW